MIISALTDCPKEKPIYYQDKCGYGTLPKEYYEKGICMIANKIAKIQWVTSVIFLDIPNTHVFFQKYQNGDLILELLPHKSSYTRMFYTLKQNEEELLVKDGQFTPSQTLESDFNSTYYGNLYLIKIGEDEYPVFLGDMDLVLNCMILKKEK